MARCHYSYGEVESLIWDYVSGAPVYKKWEPTYGAARYSKGHSHPALKITVHQWSVQEQIRRWNSIQSCRQARQLLQDDSIQFAKYTVRLSQKDLKVLVGILTGHTKQASNFAEDERGSLVPSLWRRIRIPYRKPIQLVAMEC